MQAMMSSEKILVLLCIQNLESQKKEINTSENQCIFPALTSIRNDEQTKDKFIRMVQKHGVKMKAAVAIQRKLLVLMHTLWKKEENFDSNFLSPDLEKEIGQLALP